MGFRKESSKLKKVIVSSNDNFKIEVVNNRYDYNISTLGLIDIVCSIRDDALKKQAFDSLIKDGFSGNRLLDIICSFKDDRYKDVIVRNSEEYFLTNYSTIQIVNSMSMNGIKNVLRNHTLYSFTNRDLVQIVSEMDDDNYKKDIIANYKYYCFDNEDIANIIASFSDDNYKKKVIEINSYGFDSYCKSCIIDSISDCDYKYNVIINYLKYELNSVDMSYIIKKFNALPVYIYDMLNNYRKYEFDLEVLASVVSVLSEKEKEDIVLNNTYGFTPLLLCEIIKTFREEKKRYELLNKLFLDGVFGKTDYDKKIYLPADMSIGIEIETEGQKSSFVDTDIIPSGWNIHLDSSLNRGTEVVSPILYRGDEDQIIKVCSLLKSFKQEVNSTCAGHIHIGADYFNGDVEYFKTLLDLFVNMEKIMFIIANEEGQIPRNRVLKYAHPITNKIVDVMKNKSIDFDLITDMNSFLENMHLIQKADYKPRYSSINFENIRRDTKNTIEFRIPNGTIESGVWIDNINLFGGLLYVSKKVVDAKRKVAADINNDDVLALYCYENIRNGDISDRDKLICLLNLFPIEVDRNIYLNRYDVNSELIKGFDIDEVLEGISSFRPIKITNYDASNDLSGKKLIRSR